MMKRKCSMACRARTRYNPRAQSTSLVVTDGAHAAADHLEICRNRRWRGMMRKDGLWSRQPHHRSHDEGGQGKNEGDRAGDAQALLHCDTEKGVE